MASFDPSNLPSLAGKTICVTGGTAGLGKSSIVAFAKHGPAHILFTGRNAARADAVITSVKETAPGVKVTFVPCDLASLASIASASKSITDTLSSLDILLCNAGIMGVPPALSADGYEVQFATNHLGHAALIKHLLPLLQSTAASTGDARIVLLSSTGFSLAPSAGVRFDTLNTPQDGVFGHWIRYGQSKLANLLYAAELARRYPQLSAVAVHPGVIATDLVGTLGFWDRMLVYSTNIGKMSTPEQGVYNSLWASSVPRSEFVNGDFYLPVGQHETNSKWIGDKELAGRLWDWTEKALEGH